MPIYQEDHIEAVRGESAELEKSNLSLCVQSSFRSLLRNTHITLSLCTSNCSIDLIANQANAVVLPPVAVVFPHVAVVLPHPSVPDVPLQAPGAELRSRMRCN